MKRQSICQEQASGTDALQQPKMVVAPGVVAVAGVADSGWARVVHLLQVDRPAASGRQREWKRVSAERCVGQEKRKKIKEVLTRFRSFGYNRCFTLQTPLHNCS